ncbi:RING-type domain-containing protein [Heracleum sosnowskyi]|uniref:RING-type domain-containing protein n=1 Tax=Heracleum sosnowskyi TaxID=360622 RepID=A0AAD8JGC5_9APIA|nr:RING-type domain-containing protein [Heracleum sosnowskyi]
MANIFRFFLHLFNIMIIFVTVSFLALYLFFRSIPRILDFYRPITTVQFFQLVETKNPMSHYDSAILIDQSEECSVCLSTFENGQDIRKVKQCNHSFHKHCLDKWLRQDFPTCPLCRTSVLPERIVARYRRQRDDQVGLGSKEEILMLLSAVHRHFLTRSAIL